MEGESVTEDGSKVVQVVMQDDGQMVMPEGQFIQVDMEEGQTQFIQLVGENGEQQLYQIATGPDGETHYIQVTAAEEESQLHQIIPQTDSGGGDNHLEVIKLNNENENVQTENNTLLVMKEENIALKTETEVQGSSLINLEPQQQATSPEAVAVVPDTPKKNAKPGLVSILSKTLVQPVQKPAQQPLITTQITTPQQMTSPQQSVSQSVGDNTATSKPEDTPVQPQPTTPATTIDTSSPISLTSETVVVVGGKKCVLRVDQDSGNLVAFPMKQTPIPGKRGRGRPRKVKSDDNKDPSAQTSQDEDSKNSSEENKVTAVGETSDGEVKRTILSEQENSAAEGLLGLSDTGPDGRRRSTRQRKKNTFLSEYETGQIEGAEDEDTGQDGGDELDKDPDVALDGIKRGRGRPPKAPPGTQSVQSMLVNMGLMPMKRGRGRPRRSPYPGTSSSGPIPAFIIPSPGGQAVMMAPVQNLSQLQNLQKTQIAIKPKTTEPTSTTSLENTPIIIQHSDGTQTELMQMPATEKSTEQSTEGAMEQSFIAQQNPSDNVVLETTTGEKVTVVLSQSEVDQSTQVEKKTDEDTAATEAIEETAMEVGGNEEDAVDTSGTHRTEGEKSTEQSGSQAMPPAAVIKLPPNLVSLLIPKKEPAKLGLKATESELEKFKCPKCDYQGYYQQQYQDHIATHTEDVFKCKCCTYVSFEEETLLEHYKEVHPKCICTFCNFTAEHAYVIKRHVVRHNARGCECDICGKQYKDQYILKMHVKMVHMPAEVLFECNVCSKKFTRKAHLKRHMRIHDPEKPFKCPQCDYRGCERSDINKHVLIHEEPKHVCEVCGKAFRHIKNKDLHVKRHRGQRDYKCGVCEFYGYTFTDIRKHIERKHSDAKNILCDKCGSAFKNDALLREHQKTQCEMIMMDQALTVAREDGTHTTIHIPANQLSMEGGQLMVDGNQVNITVEQIASTDEAGQVLTEAQMAEGQIISTSNGQMIDASQVEMSQMAVSESHVIDGTHVIESGHIELADTELVTSQASDVELQGEEGMIAMAE